MKRIRDILLKLLTKIIPRGGQKYVAVSCYVITVCVPLLTVAIAGCHKKTVKTYIIGIVNTLDGLDDDITGFKKGMTELEYIEGENIRYIYNGPTTDPDKLSAVVRSLKNAGVDMIFAVTTPATLRAKKETAETGIPVIFSSVTDPVGAGIVESLQRPGGNITGVTFGAQEARRLKWLLRIAPGTRKLYVPYNIKGKAPVLALKVVRNAADKLGISLIVYEISNQKTLDYAVSNIPAEADAVFLLPDNLLASRSSDIEATAKKRKLPTSSVNVTSINDSILTSYGYDQQLSGKQAARLADQVLKGARPVNLPVETAEFYLGINMKVAKEIGLTIPDEILQQADIIIRE